jgi:hypothetical protein
LHKEGKAKGREESTGNYKKWEEKNGKKDQK